MSSLQEVTRAEQICRQDFDEPSWLVNLEEMVFVLGALVLGYSVSVSHYCSAHQSSPVVNAGGIQGSFANADSADLEIRKDACCETGGTLNLGMIV